MKEKKKHGTNWLSCNEDIILKIQRWQETWGEGVENNPAEIDALMPLVQDLFQEKWNTMKRALLDNPGWQRTLLEIASEWIDLGHV